MKYSCTTLLWHGHSLEFVERIPRDGHRPAKNIFRSKDFAGLDGPKDRGMVEFTDRQLTEIAKGGKK